MMLTIETAEMAIYCQSSFCQATEMRQLSNVKKQKAVLRNRQSRSISYEITSMAAARDSRHMNSRFICLQRHRIMA